MSELINQLASALRCLPGVGQKSSQRMVMHLLERNRSGGLRLSLGPFLLPEDIDYACAAIAAVCREHASIARR